jgi:hypothetical protein
LEDSAGQGQTTAGIRVPSDWILESDILVAYRSGQPLRSIAKDFGMSVSTMCDELAGEAEPADELERLRSVRRRGQSTMGSIWDNVEMITRLDDSGIKRSEIPVVLRALGTEIDVEFAVELLHVPGIPGDDPTPCRTQYGSATS